MQVRTATDEDHAVVATFWTALSPDQPMPGFAEWSQRLRAHTLLLADGDATLGYAVCVPLGARGDIRHLMIAPQGRGRGLGRMLMEEVRGRLRAAGCTDWRLEVRADNAPAIALYRRCGMKILASLSTLRMTRADAEVFTPGVDVAVEPLLPEQDAALERRFDLGTGELARHRAVATLWHIGDVALAGYRPAFAPALSLLFPCLASSRDHVAALVMAAVRAGMREEVEFLVGDDQLAAALQAAGARCIERMVQMGGAL
jgi:ribosomal-protein-alanine N-acetyltransferase